jgi:molybdopterin-guanine dinucleotide biosynthesis protein A
VVGDLRPGLGLLGALYTGLAAADTPEVLLLGPRHWHLDPGALAGLLGPGGRGADVVYAVLDELPEPALAVYGHRCLSAIQAALLSGELKLTGWWGQVRTLGVPGPVRRVVASVGVEAGLR